MGAQGTRQGDAGDLVLDAGALIAFERADEHTKALLVAALARGARIVVPASALAQVWRGGPRSTPVARLISSAEVDSLDEDRAKDVGVRLKIRSGTDVTDAHVVCCAVDCGAAVATSDIGDIRALGDPEENLTVIAV